MSGPLELQAGSSVICRAPPKIRVPIIRTYQKWANPLSPLSEFCSFTHTPPSLAVMSINIWIFEYSNKMALKYYSYSYSCHFSSTNIFGYSFVDFWTTEYIRIFVRKFLKIRIYLNICTEPYFNICLSTFNEKSKSRYSLCTKKYTGKNLFRGCMNESF